VRSYVPLAGSRRVSHSYRTAGESIFIQRKNYLSARVGRYAPTDFPSGAMSSVRLNSPMSRVVTVRNRSCIPNEGC
jgi:hypothetical protein